MSISDTQQAAQFSADAAVSAAEAKQYLIEVQQGYQDISATTQEAINAATAAEAAKIAAETAEQDAATSAAASSESMSAAAISASQAEEFASNASDYAQNKFTFYKTSSDPDGTIAGLAATTNGQSFWVAQGPDALSAAWQYQNNAGVAVLQAKQPGTAAITGTIREFPTLAAAQADADAGNIPTGATAYYRSSDDSALAIEVINNAGTLTATGRRAASQSDVNLALSLGVKTTALMTYSGELFNGSVGWDGAEVAPGARYGGWKAPAGQTGFNTYVFAQLILSASELTFLNGKTVNFVIDITHSANLSGKLSDASLFIPMLRINGVDITNIPLNIVSISDTNTIVVFERQITSSDSSVMLAMRYRNTTALSSDVTFHNRTAYYRLQDPNGFKSELTNFNRRQYIPPVNNLAYLSPKSAEALGGATLDSTTATITIPSGQNGYNAYMGAFQRVHNNRTRAGETIRLVSKYSCSSGFLRTLTVMLPTC